MGRNAILLADKAAGVTSFDCLGRIKREMNRKSGHCGTLDPAATGLLVIVFGRFTKLNQFAQGSGLGLSICRDIATRMGAKVFLDTSYKEKGCRFVLQVPVEPKENKTT